MHEENLIHKYFNIQFDTKNIYFVSLLVDDFEYLKDSSINRYKDYIEVYEFLYEIQSLYERGIVKVENGKAIISNDDFINLESEEREKLFFTSPITFSIKIKDRGLINQDNFHLKYQILDDKYKNGEVIGCFIVNNNKTNLINKDLYELFKSIEIINSIPPEADNRETIIWEHINKLKEKSPISHSTLSGFFKDETIIIPSNMMVDLQEDEYHNFELQFNLGQLDEIEQLCLKEKYTKLNDVPNTYSFQADGRKYRIVLLPEIKDNLTTLKKMPRKIRREQDKAAILKNPTALFKFPEVVSLENFSDRVIDFGLYKNVVFDRKCSGIAWKFPIYREIHTISGEIVELRIADKEDLQEICLLLHKAIQEETPSIYFHNLIIPLSVNNLEALKDFCLTTDDEDTSNEEDSDKKSRTIKLRDNNNELFKIKINDEIIDNLKTQIQEMRTKGEKTTSVKIEDRIIPLTKENLKPLIKILEIHLVIDEDNEIISDLNEKLMAQCCSQVELPPDMKTHIELPNGKVVPLLLKDHQIKGLNWLQNSYKMKEIGRTGVLLADDMGLGKTLQILSFIFWLKDKYPENFNSSQNKPILIVAPVILLENWKNEYHRFFNETLGEPLILHGNTLRMLRNDDGSYMGKEYYQITEEFGMPKSYLNISRILKSNIVITNYDTIVNYEFSLASIDWSCIILDEAQEIKEELSYKSRILKSFKSDFKIACTGTPVENRLTDLWNIFNFLQPDLLGTRQNFTNKYSDKSMTEEKYDDLRQHFYYKKPYAYILRRMKSIELKDSLTNKYIKTHTVIMSKEEEEIFNGLKNEMLKSKTPIEVLLKMNKFSQHPRLINHSNFYNVESLINDSPKFKKLIEIIENIKLNNEKVIIFALFHELQKYLKLVLEEKFQLENIDIINGTASGTATRQKQIDSFQKRPGFNILILSPLAAGVGLNITGANHVIHYGRWWNPAKENQATDRAYRIGQTKDVYVHYLIQKCSNNTDPTFDENLHRLITSKIELAENFLKPNNIDLQDSMIQEIRQNNLLK